MCGLFGVYSPRGLTTPEVERLNKLFRVTRERGEDAAGYAVYYIGDDEAHCRRTLEIEYADRDNRFIEVSVGMPCIVIGNVRAEPTTEWIREKETSDVHPFTDGEWLVVHNGTIANDKGLEKEGFRKRDSKIDSAILPSLFTAYGDSPKTIAAGLRRVKGSYAILAMRESVGQERPILIAATNYKPLFTMRDDNTNVWFSSQANYIQQALHPPVGGGAVSLPAYSVTEYGPLKGPERGLIQRRVPILPPLPKGSESRTLIVASGGLDSTVVAAMLQHRKEVRLLHFAYACRAQEQEIYAIFAVSKKLGFEEPLILDVEHLFRQIAGTSPLLNKAVGIAQGHAGAEFAHEWVPARNLIFLSLATALAENEGYDSIVLGNNLEEAGAYPDNEQEFVNRFNHLMPYSVAADKQIVVEQPVGTYMKHQIVAEGLRIGAPLHLTWSCYEAGALHCGTCGPCTMRRLAFEMNGAKDPVEYAQAALPTDS